jgi:hypothetical protein
VKYGLHPWRSRGSKKPEARTQNPEARNQKSDFLFLASGFWLLASGFWLLVLAGVEGLEPPTPGFGDRCSGQLSYTP